MAAHAAMNTRALDSECVRRVIRDVLLGPAQLHGSLLERSAVGPVERQRCIEPHDVPSLARAPVFDELVEQ